MLKIRKITKNDLQKLKEIIDSNELFPSDLLDEMSNDFFNNEWSLDVWLTAEIEDNPIAVVYFAPERMTVGTYNLYLIAIQKEFQGKGFGKEIMIVVEQYLKELNGRILIVETSGLPEFELTRKFYDKCNYTRMALIKEFYQEGEDKVVFWKKI
jgi:ribosomal protein S18 acetylase RimI-like enzyme